MKRAVLVVLLIQIAFCIDLDKLFRRMSLHDKCGQMTQVEWRMILENHQPNGKVDPYNLWLTMVKKHVGNLVILASQNPPSKLQAQNLTNEIQKFAHFSTNLKIPILILADSPHGATLITEACVLPVQLAQATSFNITLARIVGEITGKASRAVGIPLNAHPVLDIGLHPAWPR